MATILCMDCAPFRVTGTLVGSHSVQFTLRSGRDVRAKRWMSVMLWTMFLIGQFSSYYLLQSASGTLLSKIKGLFAMVGSVLVLPLAIAIGRQARLEWNTYYTIGIDGRLHRQHLVCEQLGKTVFRDVMETDRSIAKIANARVLESNTKFVALFIDHNDYGVILCCVESELQLQQYIAESVLSKIDIQYETVAEEICLDIRKQLF